MIHLQQSQPNDRLHRGVLPNGSSNSKDTDHRHHQSGLTYDLTAGIPPHHKIGQLQNSLYSADPSSFGLRRNGSNTPIHDSDRIGGGGEQSSHASSGDARQPSFANKGSSSLLAYTYSPLEHSTQNIGVLHHWQKVPGAAAANAVAYGLADVVLGEAAWRGNGSSRATTTVASTQHSKAYRLAVKRTVMSVLASLTFGLATMVFRGRQSGLEFMAGYLVEQSLSEFRVVL